MFGLSKQWRGQSFFSTISLLSLSILVVSVLIGSEELIRDSLLFSKPHNNKRLLTFSEFYPFYLNEHSENTNRLLHFIGTSLVIFGSLWMSPRTLACLFLAAPFAVVVFYATVMLPRGQAEMATTFILCLLLNKISTGSFKGALACMLCGYGFAWVGHFVFEGNRPATFTYPIFSLMGDFRMWTDIATGRLPFE
jgi:hypothetical protein